MAISRAKWPSFREPSIYIEGQQSLAQIILSLAQLF
jgi:hypothetical protein